MVKLSAARGTGAKEAAHGTRYKAFRKLVVTVPGPLTGRKTAWRPGAGRAGHRAFAQSWSDVMINQCIGIAHRYGHRGIRVCIGFATAPGMGARARLAILRVFGRFATLG